MEIERMVQLAADAEVAWEEFSPVMKARAWKSIPESDQIEYRNALASVIAYTEDLRVPFDDAIWRGHTDGTVKRSVESIRTKTEHKTKPGRPAPTLEQQRAKVLAKKGIVLPTVVEVTDEVTEAPAE